MKFAYQGFSATGKTVTGSIEAVDAADASESLRRQNVYVTSVGPDDGSGSVTVGKKRRRRLGQGKRMKNLAMFFRQLSVLVSSGTPLVQALGSLEKQAREPAWREIVGNVKLKIEEGSSLSAAMADHPDIFDGVSRSLIAAGESGGGFDVMLDRMATLTKKQMQVRSAVVGAMIYPALLIFIAIAVLNLMLLFVLPRFTGLFASLDVPLPPTTKFLVDLSDLLRSYWWMALIVIIGGGFGSFTWAKTKGGKRIIDTILLKAPMSGPVVKAFAFARITRVLGVLLNGKVPLLEALGLARQTVANVHFVKLVESAEDAVTRGGTLSGVFEESKLVNATLVEAIRSGESSGQLAALLLNMAEFLDEENEVVIKSLTSILEPIILIGLGLVVGFIAISMFLPLFDLTSMTQGAH